MIGWFVDGRAGGRAGGRLRACAGERVGRGVRMDAGAKRGRGRRGDRAGVAKAGSAACINRPVHDLRKIFSRETVERAQAGGRGRFRHWNGAACP